MREHIKVIYEEAIKVSGVNSVKRCLANTCHELYDIEQKAMSQTSISVNNSFCYGCGIRDYPSHPVYVYMCKLCGNKYQTNRTIKASLPGKVALVIGARTKLGHQTVLKLLRAECIVYGTTRKPEEAVQMYEKYPDHEGWISNLKLRKLDLDTSDIQGNLKPILNEISQEHHSLDYLINIAAQTIRTREKIESPVSPSSSVGEISLTNSDCETGGSIDFIRTDKNRYGDAKYADDLKQNSWQLQLHEVSQQEFEEVFRINSIAPAIIISECIPLIKKSTNPYIINVHSREGIMNVKKSKHHIHLNMAKSALAMLTYNMKYAGYKTVKGDPIRVHGIDPGWISIDEYFEKELPWIVPPIDEIDGASKIVYPIFKNIRSCYCTTRHYNSYIN
jgi:NAD(P)-dependent dehydrogenase (short-subunit alcohol dehydrogenase family)